MPQENQEVPSKTIISNSSNFEEQTAITTNNHNGKPKHSKNIPSPTTWGGAGILPFARAPNPTGDIYLLLGKEDIIPNWKFGSNKWCDFSGGKEDADVDIEETAARELYEESLAVLPLWEHLSVSNDNNADSQWENRKIGDTSTRTLSMKAGTTTNKTGHHWRCFAESLRQKKYTYRFDRTRADGRVQTKRYTCFLVEVPFCPNAPKEFEKLRGRLVRLRKLSRCWHEKLAEIDQMTEDVREILHTFLPGNTLLYNSKTKTLRSPLYSARPSVDMTSISKAEESYYLANVSLSVENSDEIVSMRLISTLASNSNVLELKRNLIHLTPEVREKVFVVIKSWSRLLDEFRSLPYAIRKHPAISATRVPNTSYISDITVLDCYMEKQSVKWWSLPWLREGLQNGGAFRMELYRGAFSPFISVVLDLFSGASPGRFVVNVRPWTSSSTFGTALHKKKSLGYEKPLSVLDSSKIRMKKRELLGSSENYRILTTTNTHNDKDKENETESPILLQSSRILITENQ